jgi:hypothetical protein
MAYKTTILSIRLREEATIQPRRLPMGLMIPKRYGLKKYVTFLAALSLSFRLHLCQ